MLRRTKNTILNGKPLLDLPDRIVNSVQCEFDEEERQFEGGDRERDPLDAPVGAGHRDAYENADGERQGHERRHAEHVADPREPAELGQQRADAGDEQRRLTFLLSGSHFPGIALLITFTFYSHPVLWINFR